MSYLIKFLRWIFRAERIEAQIRNDRLKEQQKQKIRMFSLTQKRLDRKK